MSVLGLGEEDGVEFRISRNIWGTYWDESGFFKIQMYRNNLVIEEDSSWGVVDKEPHYVTTGYQKMESIEEAMG